MKKLFKILFVISLLNTQYSFVNAQNLVPNPSFEDTIGCPEGYPDLDGKCADWMSFRGSPDYFHECSSQNGFNNAWGHQIPNTGKAYTSIITYGISSSLLREHLGVQLVSPLTIGTKYYLSYFVSTAWEPIGMNIATNKIGALFTTYLYNDPSSINSLNNYCQIFTNTIVNDTIGWVKISGSFIPDSSYNYIVIGNFFDDIFTDTINLPMQSLNQRSMYYIDDICLSTDSLFTQNWTNIIESIETENSFLVYPNPANNTLNIRSSCTELKTVLIYDCYGQLVLKSNEFFSTDFPIEISSFESGTYILKLTSDNNPPKFQKLIVSN